MVNGQHFSGTGYQLDGTENRDPILGIIVINPTLESIGESEDHLAELRRRVRPGDRRRRLGRRPSRARTVPRQRLRVPPERQVPGAQPVLAAGRREPDHRPRAARDQARPVRRLDRRAHQEGQVLLLRRLPGLALHGRRLEAADGADGARAHGRPERVRRQHLRSGNCGLSAPARSPPSAQFPGNVIPDGPALAAGARRSSACCRCPTHGHRNGTRDNFIAQGSEKFNSDAFNVRLDGRISANMNTFARYSYAKFDKTRPLGVRRGRRPGRRRPRRQHQGEEPEPGAGPRLHAHLHVGAGRALRLVPLQRGRASRTTSGRTRARRRHPRHERRGRPFTSGLPRRAHQPGRRRGHGLRHRPGRRRSDASRAATARSSRTRSSSSSSPTSRRAWASTPPSSASTSAAPTTCACPATSTARARSTSTPSARRGRRAAAWGSPPSCSGDVSGYRRYVSSSTDARERQWRWFFYAQDTWRARTKWTFNYGIRLEDIMPQTVNEAGNAGFFDVGDRARCAWRASAASASTATSRTRSTSRRASASPTSSTRRPSSASATAAATTSACSAPPSATA